VDSSSIRLPGSEIAGASFADGTLRVRFSRAFILKTMTGSDEQTLWWQSGELVLDGAELLETLPAEVVDAAAAVPEDQSFECDGGDVEENVYTYRDMIPVPLTSRGHCGCDLGLRGITGRIRASGESIRLEMHETPHYIEHIRAQDGGRQ
jgi:hypothetical protein